MRPHSRLSYGRRSNAAFILLVAAALALVLMLLIAACGSGSTGSTDTTLPVGETTTVTTVGSATGGTQVIMTNRSYNPATVTIKVGDKVTWVNQDAPQHDVVADNGEFNSQLFDKGQSFSFTFTKAGTYPYHCSIHPGMTGTVVVQ
jgi:plastocyanin